MLWVMFALPLATSLWLLAPRAVDGTPEVLAEFPNPADWLGTDLPLLDYLEDAAELSQGGWIVILYRPDCSLCDRALRQLRPIFRDEGQPHRIALINVSSGTRFQVNHSESQHWIDFHTRLASAWRGRIPTPLMVSMVDGKVLKVETSSQFIANWRRSAHVSR
jgi:hypothetical protein